ncbi:MAG: 4-alpha-glucanotransferase [Deltaproteobacteria bacterium]|nr:4-alpha-glucanotransferase [Deltaproteobacteria bacterium]
MAVLVPLPSRFGIGDFGPSARDVVDCLAEAVQRYWQVFPLTPTDNNHGNSLYRSDSAFAINPLLISQEILLNEGVISEEKPGDLPGFHMDQVDYPSATQHKDVLIS